MIDKMISHYKVLDKIGEGGMGVVYKAHDTKLDRTVALKFLPTHLGSDETEKRRFLNEAKAASALDHNNICSIYSIEESNEGNVFIVMAYYEGMSLKEKIEQGPLSIKDIVDYAIQITSGLQKAHVKGIIHRDLKPANIFITNDDQIKIIDFGLARVAERMHLTKSGTTLGTVPYMSPEQAQGTKIDHRTDIWSLGVVLYEMISGKRPFKSEYETALVYSIINEEPEPVTGLRSGVPMELERIVQKCLEKDPSDRYQHTDEIIVDLRRVANEISSFARTTATTARERHKDNSKVERSGIQKNKHVMWFIPILLIFATLGYWYFTSSGRMILSGTIQSIAVLPLVNISGDLEQEYFSDGMTEELITELAKIKALRVISRTSIMQYKGINKPIRDIARELKVDAVVEGSVLRSGAQVRINAQLIDVKSDRHMWTNSYTRDLSDILILQSDVARAIVDEIKVKLTSEDIARFRETGRVHPDAYEAFLKGRYYWNQRNPESLGRAIHFYEQAIAIDPEYADAYRGLGSTYMILGIFYANPHENFPNARTNIEKALRLDRQVLGGNLGLGAYNLFYEWDWLTADRYLNREVDLYPTFDHVNNVRGVYLTSLGKGDEAIGEFQKALMVDPLSLIINVDFANAYYMMRRYDQAIVQCQWTIDINPDFVLAYIPIAAAYTEKGEYETAISILVTAQSRLGESQFGGPPILLAELAYGYAKSGSVDEARQILQNLRNRASSEYIDPYIIASIHVALEENSEAIDWLEKAVEARSSRMVWLDVEPKFDSLRNDQRFVSLREKAGFVK